MAPQDLLLAHSGVAKDQVALDVEQATGGDVVVERVLGVGRMARVYVAEQLSLDRRVAVKVLLPRRGRDRRTLTRFRREARAMAGCSHPGIVSVFSVGETARGLPFFVMEYVEGETLEGRLRRRGKLPLQEVRRIVTAVADALTYAHGHGLVHRDVKPGNVLLERGSGRVLLTDFGLAKPVKSVTRVTTLTGTGELMGTPEYLSPEQAERGEVDARSDQYSLAVMAYEMLAGRLPFLGPEPQDYVRQHVEDTPPWLPRIEPTIPLAVSKAVDRGLMKEPGARYGSAEAFGQALSAAAEATAAAEAMPQRAWWGYERQLVQATAIYAGAAWGVLEALTWVLETFDLPMEFRQPALLLVVGGLPLTLALLCYARNRPQPVEA
ncbi:MAG: serine/threonine protein kinase [Gemmatimonadota bacterium]|nr:MAG: serine/threonine protein kinase [Gemmatimonadota bacterium]